MRRFAVLTAISLAASGAVACTAILGVKDIYLDEDAGQDGGGTEAGGDGSLSDGTSGDGPANGDGGQGGDGANGDAGTCPGADLTSDPKNCGRCGHDCAGSTCTGSKCDPMLLAGTLANPDGIGVDDTNVYVTTFGDGKVIAIPKIGGMATALAGGQTSAQGIALDGMTLYWSNGDFPADGLTKKGGVWKCTLPKCSVPQLVCPGDFAINVQLLNGVAYFSANNDSTVRRALPDGGSAVVANTNRPFGLGVDSTYAYYTSSQPSVYRAPLDGGAEEAVGPLDSLNVGYVALDATRFYWAYLDANNVGHVYGANKSDPANRTEYGSGLTGGVGVAVDASYVYFNTDGHFSGNTPNGDGQLLACPIAGCSASGPILLADKLVGGGPIALDQNAVYWVEYGENGGKTGRARKVAKP